MIINENKKMLWSYYIPGHAFFKFEKSKVEIYHVTPVLSLTPVRKKLQEFVYASVDRLLLIALKYIIRFQSLLLELNLF